MDSRRARAASRTDGLDPADRSAIDDGSIRSPLATPYLRSSIMFRLVPFLSRSRVLIARKFSEPQVFVEEEQHVSLCLLREHKLAI
jgi:hypothetical protein